MTVISNHAVFMSLPALHLRVAAPTGTLHGAMHVINGIRAANQLWYTFMRRRMDQPVAEKTAELSELSYFMEYDDFRNSMRMVVYEAEEKQGYTREELDGHWHMIERYFDVVVQRNYAEYKKRHNRV